MGGPLLDIHLHLRPRAESNLAHMDGSSVTRAVLLTRVQDAEQERALVEKLIRGLLEIPKLKFYGITDPKRFDHRCPTVAIRIDGHTPADLANQLNERGFFTWDGNYYAINLSERLGAEASGGFLRIGLAHYNTADEVERLLVALQEITR